MTNEEYMRDWSLVDWGEPEELTEEEYKRRMAGEARAAAASLESFIQLSREPFERWRLCGRQSERYTMMYAMRKCRELREFIAEHGE